MSNRPPWLFRQSAAIPFRWHEGRVEVLLITSSSGKRWIIPKGIVEKDLSPAESAAQEAIEEAGVEGVVGTDPVGEYRYDKWGGTCVVKVYLLEVRRELETWQEAVVRRREWVALEEAPRRVTDGGLRTVLRGLSASDFRRSERR